MSPEKSSSVTKPGFAQPGFLLPAVQAAMIQCFVLVLLYGILQAAWMLAGWQTSIGVAVLMQGAFAAILSSWRRLPYWWIVIQFLFPIALLLTFALGIPAWAFLLCFLALVLVYWTPFRTRVPLFLSGRHVWEKVIELLPDKRPLRFLDAGSGLGGLAMHIAERCPGVDVTGIELAPFPWLLSWLHSRVRRNRVHFLRGQYEDLDFANFDVVFAYLSPAAMESFWQKASAEMRPGTLLLSYEFPLLVPPPDQTIHFEADGSILFVWHINGISQKQDSPLQFQ